MEEAEAVEFSPSYRILEVTEESDEESNHNNLKNEFSNSQHESHQDTAQSAKNQYQTHKQPQEIIEIDENLDDGEEQSFQYSKKKVDSSGKEIDEYYQNMSFQNSPNQPQILQINNNNLQPSQKINQNNNYGYQNQQNQQQQQMQQQQQFQNGVPSFNLSIQRNGEKYELKSASKNLMQTFSNTQNQQNSQQIPQNPPVQIFKPQNNFNNKQIQNQNVPPQSEEENRERKLSVQPVRLIDQEAFLMKGSPQNQNNNVNYNNSNNNQNSNASINTSHNSRNNARAQTNSSDKKRNEKNSQQNDQQFSNQVQYLINKRTQAQLKKEQLLSSQKKQMLNQQLLNASDDEMENIVPMSSNPNKLPLTLVQQENLERQYKDVLLELESTQKQLDEVEKSLRIETLNFEESKRHVQILKMALQQKVEENTLKQILAEVSHDARINKVDLYTFLARQMNQQQLEGDKNKHRVVELERQVKKLKQINDEQSKQMQQLQEFNESINVELKNAIYALQMAEDEKDRMLAEQRQQIQDQNSLEKDQLLDYLTECKNQINVLQQEIINLKHQVNSKALNYSIASDHSNPNKNSQVQQQITAGDVKNISNGFSNKKQQLTTGNQHLQQISPEQLFSNLSNNKLNNSENSFSLQNNQVSLNFSKNINNDSAEGKNSLLDHHLNQDGSLGSNMVQYALQDELQRQDQSHTQNYHAMQTEDRQNYNEASQNSLHQPQNLQKRFQDEELEDLLKEIEESNIQNMQPQEVIEKLQKLCNEAKRLKQEVEQNNLVIQDYKMRQENERQNYSDQIKELFEQLSQTRQELRSKKDQFEQLESNQMGLEEQIESYDQILQQKQEEYEKVNEELRQLRQIAGDRLQEMNEIKLKYEIENSALQQEVEQLNVIVQEYESSINQDKNSSEDRSSSIQFNSQRSGQQIAIRQSNSPKNYSTFQTGNLAKQGNEQNHIISRQTQDQESTQNYNVSTLNSQIERLQSDLYQKDQQIQLLDEEAKQKDIHIHHITEDFEKQIQHLNQQIEDIQSEKETIIHENDYCKKEVQKLMEKDLINTNKLKDKKEVKQLQQQLDTKQLEVEKLLLEKENLNYFVEAYRKFIFNENIKRAIQEYIGVVENISSLEYQRRENVHKINSLELQQTLEEYQNDIIKIKEEIISLKENQFSLDDQKKVLLTRKIQLDKELEGITIQQSDRYQSWQTLEEDYQEIKKKGERQVREFTLKEITYNNVQTAYNDLLKEYGRLLSQSITQQKKPLMRNQSAQGGQTFILNKSLQSNLSLNQFSPNKKSTIQELSAEQNSHLSNNYTIKKSPDDVQGKKSRYDSSHHNNDITSSNYYDNMLIIDNDEDVYNQQVNQNITNFMQNKENQQNLE